MNCSIPDPFANSEHTALDISFLLDDLKNSLTLTASPAFIASCRSCIAIAINLDLLLNIYFIIAYYTKLNKLL